MDKPKTRRALVGWNAMKGTVSRYQISAIDAGISASIGAIQKPWRTLAATRDTKLLASAAQNEVTIKPIEVMRYTGLFPYFTAIVFQIRLPTAMAAITPPCTPEMNVFSGLSKSFARGTKAAPRRGPTAADNVLSGMQIPEWRCTQTYRQHSRIPTRKRL